MPCSGRVRAAYALCEPCRRVSAGRCTVVMRARAREPGALRGGRARVGRSLLCLAG